MNEFIEVSGKLGTASFLYAGSEKTALFDCGMAHSAPVIIKNIKNILGERPLDFIFLTHSHYDHMGALPHIKAKWPNAAVLGSEYAAYVFTRPGALRVIREYGRIAAAEAGGAFPEYDDELVKIDRPLKDGETVDIGGQSVLAVELLGHTKCSMGFLIDGKTLFASESTGVLDSSGCVHPTYVLSANHAIASAKKCRDLAPEKIIAPHYGIIEAKDYPDYWQKCIDAVEEQRRFVRRLLAEGHSDEVIAEAVTKEYWISDIKKNQPHFAFSANAKVVIDTIRENR